MMLSRNILPRIYRKLNEIALCGLNEDYARTVSYTHLTLPTT